MQWRYEVLIGPNKTTLPFDKNMRADTRYIAIDPAYGEQFPARINKDMQRTYGVSNERLKEYPFKDLAARGVVFLGQSATETLLPAASIDVIRMIDVLNMPISWYPEPQSAVVDVWGRGLFKEMSRILKPDGRIVIGAKTTPEFCSPERVEMHARMHGLEVRTLLPSGWDDAQVWGDETYTWYENEWEFARGRAYLVELRHKDGNGPSSNERNL